MFLHSIKSFNIQKVSVPSVYNLIVNLINNSILLYICFLFPWKVVALKKIYYYPTMGFVSFIKFYIESYNRTHNTKARIEMLTLLSYLSIVIYFAKSNNFEVIEKLTYSICLVYFSYSVACFTKLTTISTYFIFSHLLSKINYTFCLLFLVSFYVFSFVVNFEQAVNLSPYQGFRHYLRVLSIDVLNISNTILTGSNGALLVCHTFLKNLSALDFKHPKLNIIIPYGILLLYVINLRQSGVPITFLFLLGIGLITELYIKRIIYNNVHKYNYYITALCLFLIILNAATYYYARDIRFNLMFSQMSFCLFNISLAIYFTKKSDFHQL